jgi:hypothetical protein
MKKTLKHLVKAIEQSGSGSFKGGFTSIRGGRDSLLIVSNPDYCTNPLSCENTNQNHCTNTVRCDEATNKKNCTNKLTCIIDA